MECNSLTGTPLQFVSSFYSMMNDGVTDVVGLKDRVTVLFFHALVNLHQKDERVTLIRSPC